MQITAMGVKSLHEVFEVSKVSGVHGKGTPVNFQCFDWIFSDLFQKREVETIYSLIIF